MGSVMSAEGDAFREALLYSLVVVDQGFSGSSGKEVWWFWSFICSGFMHLLMHLSR